MNAERSPAFCMAELVHLQSLPEHASLIRVLDTGEATRLGRIRNELRRRQFLGGHWLVRHLACGRFGGSPTDWRWRSNENGQPSLHLEGHALRVSVSHSGEWLACAISSEPVGIDVEVPGRERDWVSLANFAFSSERDWSGLPLPERKSKFINWWCLHEARGKRDGHGAQIGVMRRLRLISCAPGASDAISWPLSEGFVAIAGARDVTLRGCADRRSHWQFQNAVKHECRDGRA